MTSTEQIEKVLKYNEEVFWRLMTKVVIATDNYWLDMAQYCDWHKAEVLPPRRVVVVPIYDNVSHGYELNEPVMLLNKICHKCPTKNAYCITKIDAKHQGSNLMPIYMKMGDFKILYRGPSRDEIKDLLLNMDGLEQGACIEKLFPGIYEYEKYLSFPEDKPTFI